ncbi:regulator [Streptomyces alkaliphilus]|uniref:regulator n=1 Tax=Streptomyces alkaliphilus TaxID=1472722 RepID=UPI001181038A|nr:regulator [Streptomyces alkaliphilus]MQS07564.1 regulator [Streptomyces alkaliphilus]
MSTERPGDSSTPQSPRRPPNRQLAALIAEAGFSHAGLARRVDQLGLEHGLDLRYDKTSVTRWLRGQRPRGTTPALIAEVFTRRLGRRLSARDLGLEACAPVYAGLEFAAGPHEAVEIVSGLWRKDTGGYAELRRIAFTPAGLVVPSRDWLIGRPDERVSRGVPAPGGPGAPLGDRVDRAARVPEQGRGAGGRVPPGHGGPGTGPAHAVPGVPAPLAIGARGGAVPAGRDPVERGPGRRVTAGDLAALRSVAELFRTLDHAYGGGHARQALIRYLEHELEPLLRGTYGEQMGRRLFGAAADLTRLAGWTAYDIGAHGLAQRYFVQALRLSQAAGDRVHGAFVLAAMSRQAAHLGHGREAVQLARVAQQGLSGTAPQQVHALLHAAEARGHALLGDARSCTAALARAERAMEIVRPGERNGERSGERPGEDVPPWIRFFDEAQLADEFAHCHRDLQQYRSAARYADRALQLRAPAYARSRLFTRVVLATARLGLGEVEQACVLAAEAAQQAVEMRSVRAHEYLRDFERRLEPHRDTTAARSYRERISATG